MGTSATRRSVSSTHLPTGPNRSAGPERSEKNARLDVPGAVDGLIGGTDLSPVETKRDTTERRRKDSSSGFKIVVENDLRSLQENFSRTKKRLAELAKMMEAGEVSAASMKIDALVAEMKNLQNASHAEQWGALMRVAHALNAAKGFATIKIMRVPTHYESSGILGSAATFVRDWGISQSRSRMALATMLRNLIVAECERSNPDGLEPDNLTGRIQVFDPADLKGNKAEGKDGEAPRNWAERADRTPTDFDGFIYLTALTDDGGRLRFVLEKNDDRAMFLTADENDAATDAFLSEFKLKRAEKSRSGRIETHGDTPLGGTPVLPDNARPWWKWMAFWN